jgi:steroid 5-alpha reductase family enzyme
MSWGLFIIALTFVDTNPLILITIVGPILYSLLIRFVTGVPPLEKHLINKPGYKEYMQKTSMIIPWFPKKTDKKEKE